MAWVSAVSQRPGKEEFEVVVCPAVNSWECPQVDYLVLITASGEEGGEAVAGGMAAARLTSDQLEEVPLPDLCFVGCHGFTRSPRVREISAGTQLILLATAAEPWFGFGGRQWSLLLQGWPFPGLSWQAKAVVETGVLGVSLGSDTAQALLPVRPVYCPCWAPSASQP